MYPENTSLEQYIRAHSTLEDSVLSELVRETHLKVINPRMLSGHIQGELLKMFSRMIRPRTILEIGTFTGYSAICLAQGLAPEGLLHTIEIDDELEEFAARFFAKAGLQKQIVQHIGNALEIIPHFTCQFDLIFIDGEKREYPEYYALCKQKLAPGGFIIADNVLWNGKVLEEEADFDKATFAINQFNKQVTSDPETDNILLPYRDGLMVVYKK